MDSFFLFIVLVLSAITSGVVFGIRRTVRTLKSDQLSLSMRLDSLRQELRKTPPVPLAKSPAPEPQSQTAAPVPQPRPATVQPARDVAPPPRPVSAVAPLSAPARPAAPVEPSKLVESAKDILAKMWNWILVGEEHRPSGVTAEYAVASVWLLRLSIVAIVAGLVYFLKWSIEKELIGPAARVSIGALAGIGLAVWGMKILGKKYHVIGQGLLGGGLLIMYFSAYASGPMYRLFEQNSLPAAFGLMILITVAAGILSVKADSLLIAILGMIGGYLTPVMLRTPTPNLPVFYSYMLLLGLGIVAIAHYKQWRLLNYLGFLFTYVLFYGSALFPPTAVYQKHDFPMVLSFLCSFFVLHSSLVYLHNVVRRKPSTNMEVLHLVANAAVFAGFAYPLIEGAHGRPYPALMSLGLAVFYIVHVLGFLRRKLLDRPLLVALIALSGVFTTWTLPLVMEKESLTIALAMLAFMFLWLGQRVPSRFLENLGHGVYLIVFYRLLAMDLPRNFHPHAGTLTPFSDYWKHMADRLWTFGSSIASIALAFFLEKRTKRPAGLAPAPGGDTPEIVTPHAASVVFYWFGILFAFLFLHLELNRMFLYWDPLRLPILTLLWCGMAAYFLWKHLTGAPSTPIMFMAMAAFLIAGILKVFVFDLRSWHFCESCYFDMEYAPLYVGMRCLDFGVLLAMMFTAWRLLTRRGGNQEQTLAPAFGYGGLILLFIYASLELNSFLYWVLPKFQTGGVSVLWALFAIAFLSGGIWKSVTPLRYTGLILFCVVVGKVFLVDLRQMPMIYRVMAFITVGILLLLGSFAYIRSSAKFTRNSSLK